MIEFFDKQRLSIYIKMSTLFMNTFPTMITTSYLWLSKKISSQNQNWTIGDCNFSRLSMKTYYNIWCNFKLERYWTFNHYNQTSTLMMNLGHKIYHETCVCIMTERLWVILIVNCNLLWLMIVPSYDHGLSFHTPVDSDF